LPPIISRTLKTEFRIFAENSATYERLRFMEAAPTLVGSALVPVDLEVHDVEGFCRLRLPNGFLVEGSPTQVLSALHGLVLRDLWEGEPGAPLVHGASVIAGDRRLLLVGHKGCGKTTLSLHLVARGYAVEGDEQVVLRELEVIARPRTLRVKPGTLSLVKDVPASAWEAPSIEAWDGTPIRAISPAIAGRVWRIAPGPLDAIVFLVANHGARSVARLLTTKEAFTRLMGETLLPPTGIAAAAARLRRLVLGTPCFEMMLGDLITAEWHINNIAQLLTSPPAQAHDGA